MIDMMKVLMVVSFMGFMVYVNNMVIFYSNLCFFLSVAVMLMYNMSLGDCWMVMGAYSGMDSYSYYMVLLSLWVVGLMFMSLHGVNSPEKVKLFMFMVVLLVLLLFFSVMNLMLMYFFFEFSLIPTFFIVVMWGGNYERMEASFYLVMYMMFISFPLLAYIMKTFLYNFSLDMNILSILGFNDFSLVMGVWDYLIFFTAFFIKLPIYMFHVWLPKAHVEAPVYGSMLLAAVLLKLGGYGLLRLIVMFIEQSLNMGCMIVSLGILGSVYVSIHCLMQVDMKSLVAYSSVVHMNFMLCSLYSLMKLGAIGSVLVMISHGLCSSGLFYMVNMFYSRTHSRMIIFNKGSLGMVPSVGVWWFFLCSSNFSFPFSLNFLGEISLIMTLLSWGLSLLLFIGLISFFSGAYSLFLFSGAFYGQMGVNMVVQGVLYCNGLLVEHVNLLLHCSPLILLVFNLTLFSV